MASRSRSSALGAEHQSAIRQSRPIQTQQKGARRKALGDIVANHAAQPIGLRGIDAAKQNPRGNAHASSGGAAATYSPAVPPASSATCSLATFAISSPYPWMALGVNSGSKSCRCRRCLSPFIFVRPERIRCMAESRGPGTTCPGCVIHGRISEDLPVIFRTEGDNVADFAHARSGPDGPKRSAGRSADRASSDNAPDRERSDNTRVRHRPRESAQCSAGRFVATVTGSCSHPAVVFGSAS